LTTQTLSPALQISSASTWRSRLRALGPGILMASAAIGGSHLVASTQAGALYGWQLALIIVLTNLFKYPFFRFSAHYTLDSGKSLIEGYAEKSRAYLWVFLVMCFLSSTISAAAVALLTAVIVKTALPGLPAGPAITGETTSTPRAPPVQLYAWIRVPERPAMTSAVLLSDPMTQVRPGRLSANLMAALTFGSMEPLPNCPSLR